MRYSSVVLAGVGLLFLSGCTTLSQDMEGVRTLTDAGISYFEAKPVLAEPPMVSVGTSYKVILGKAYKSVTINVDLSGEKPKVAVTAIGVEAFAGQKTAQAALIKARQALTAQNISQANTGALIAVQAIDAALKAMVP